MSNAMTVKVDKKGRIVLPLPVRKAGNILPGDVLFVKSSEKNNMLILMKGENPFEALALDAVKEYRAGKTKSIEDLG